MNIEEAKKEIKHTVQAYLSKDETGDYEIASIRQRPMLLMGPPGIGKTQIMEQIARECEIALVAYTITHHTRQSAVGLPFIKEEEFDGKVYAVTEYTMSEIIASVYAKIRETGLKEGILFIDEINCVSETLAPTMLQFLQCKTFGNQAIPEGWVIVAAGNPPEYNKSVREFDMVTLDRVRRIDITADYGVWKKYAREKNLHNALLSYLEIRPQNFYRVEADVDGLQFVTARGWEDLSELLQTYDKLNITVTEDVVYEFLRHPDVAEDVAAYIELYQKYKDDYGVDEILKGQADAAVYERIYRAAFDERLSVVHLLLDALFGYMKRAEIEKKLTDAWYAFLKEYRSQIEVASDTVACYQKLLKEKTEDFAKREKANLYTKEQRKQEQVLLMLLQQNVPVTKDNPAKCFEEAKVFFVKQRSVLEEKTEAASKALEAAFDFVETAFENGEEMVVFVTELTMTETSAKFLGDYTCERYLKYNQELLIGTRRRELLSELADKA